MILEDILSLIGRSSSPKTDCTPIACLLNRGYGRAGSFNPFVNERLSDTILLFDLGMVNLRVEEDHSHRGRVADFDDFLQDVVPQNIEADDDGEESESIDMRLTDLRVQERHSRRVRIADFDDFLQDIVPQHVEADEDSEEFEPIDGMLKVLRTLIW